MLSTAFQELPPTEEEEEIVLKFVRSLINRIFGRRVPVEVTNDNPLFNNIDHRAKALEDMLLRCGLSRRCAKRVAVRVIAQYPDFDLNDNRCAGIRYALEAIRDDYQKAFEHLLSEIGEGAYEWRAKVYRGEVVFVPALFYDF